MFGQLIHEITGPVIPDRDSRRSGRSRGRRGGRASAAAGDRQRALRRRTRADRPAAKLSTQANAILGQGQLSLAKYLAHRRPAKTTPSSTSTTSPSSSATCSNGPTGDAICTSRPGRRSTRSTTRARACTRARRSSSPRPARRNGSCRWRWTRRITIAGGSRLQAIRGSAAGDPRDRRPGVQRDANGRDGAVKRFCVRYSRPTPSTTSRWSSSSTTASSTARTLSNFLWVTFTRSNPATDIYGIDAVHGATSTGDAWSAGRRRPRQAAPRAAAGRGPRGHPPRRRPRGPRAAAVWHHLMPVQEKGKKEKGEEKGKDRSVFQ